ncbi:MAG: hypothetical protein LBT38_02910 [Deltaproteobacteria bacterium]|nr:hypothetical protein [Deltaproteobacteria bacterium]
MSMGTNETLDSPILEPLSSGALPISDTETRLRRLEELMFSAQTVDQKTSSKVEEKPVANTVQVDNNKDLGAKFDALSAKFDAKFDALSAKFDVKYDALDAKYNTLNTTVEVLGARFEGLNSKIKIFMWIISLVALILMGIAVPAHFSLSDKLDANEKAANARMDAFSAKIDTRLNELTKTVSDMRVDIGKLQVFSGQPPVAEQQKSPTPAETKQSPAPAETKGEAIPDQNSQ